MIVAPTTQRPEALTVAQIAADLQVSHKTVYRLVQRGLLARVPGIRHVRITRKSLQAFMATAES